MHVSIYKTEPALDDQVLFPPGNILFSSHKIMKSDCWEGVDLLQSPIEGTIIKYLLRLQGLPIFVKYIIPLYLEWDNPQKQL
jgi:hypothetical protein